MKKLLLILVFVAGSLFAQGNYTATADPVYIFLQEITLKTGIEYDDMILPKTRNEIARVLASIDSISGKLTTVEKERLNLFLSEYAREMKMLTGKLYEQPWYRAYTNDNGEFAFTAAPIVGFGVNNIYGELQKKRYSGALVYGSWGENFGFQMDFRDYQENGTYLDTLKTFTSETGVQLIGGTENARQYSEVRGSLNYETKKIKISVGKDFMNWGSGYNGRIILSSKAPSFPYIRFELHPADWISFTYFHAWLNSRVPDSTEFYKTQIMNEEGTAPIYRLAEREKWMAAHILQFHFHKNVSLSLGESVVYSDVGPKIGFMIPVLFWRLVDHYYEGKDSRGKGSNSQLFTDLVWKFPGYGRVSISTFIDEISIAQFFDKDNNRNQFGFTLSSVFSAPSISNTTVRAEYTRLNPWVYSNFIQTQTYTSSGYVMGHYLGQNAEQLYLRVDHYLQNNLTASVYFEYNKRGGMDSVSYQYSYPSKEFMYGKIRKDVIAGAELRYMYMARISATLAFKSMDITDEMPGRTPAFMLGRKNSVSLNVSYNF